MLGVTFGNVVLGGAAGVVAIWLGWLICLELGEGDSIHPAENMTVNMKRNTLPPRTLGSVPGLIPCRQQSNARLRDIRVSPGSTVVWLSPNPPRSSKQPIAPVISVTDPK